MPKKFRTTMNGYCKEEVNDFLGNITKEYEDLLEQYKVLEEKNKTLELENEQYKAVESGLRRALSLADEAGRSMKKMAEEESTRMIEDAKKNASRIVNDALLRAQKIDTDADTIKRRMVGYRNRIQTILKEEQEMLDKYEDIEY